MSIRTTISIFPKSLAALVGFAWIFGFTSHASAANATYYLEISSSSAVATAVAGIPAGSIPVTGFSFKGTAGGTGGITGGSGPQSLTVSRVIDANSPNFITDELFGSLLGTVKLYCIFNKNTGEVAGKPKHEELVYIMSDCQVTSVTDEGDAEGQEDEEVTFSFSGITLQYSP